MSTDRQTGRNAQVKGRDREHPVCECKTQKKEETVGDTVAHILAELKCDIHAEGAESGGAPDSAS